MVAKHIAHAFHQAGEFDSITKRDALTGLPSLTQLEQLLNGTGVTGSKAGDESSLIFVDVVGLADIAANHGRVAVDDAIRHVVREIRSSLRLTDILFRCGAGEFVALLNDTETALANLIAARISDAIRIRTVAGRNSESFGVEVVVRVIRTPNDGRTFGQLRNSLEGRSARQEHRPGSSVH